MPKSHSIADAAFIVDFARQLLPHYIRARSERKLHQMARKLGVTAPALQKYADGVSMPGIGTVVAAYREYGVLVPYDGAFIAADIAHKSRKRRRSAEPDIQMELPFALRALGPGRVDVRIAERGANRYHLAFRLRSKTG